MRSRQGLADRRGIGDRDPGRGLAAVLVPYLEIGIGGDGAAGEYREAGRQARAGASTRRVPVFFVCFAMPSS